MYLTILMLSIFTSLTFIFMTHPLAMGFMLLIQTLLISMLTGLLSKTFWFSYILFIVFLGGMLVLFIYVTSLASNEMFMMSAKTLNILSITMMITLLMLLLGDMFFSSDLINNTDSISIYSTNSLNKENTINLNKLYNFPTNFMTILLINYLFLVLIAIVKVTNVFYGPLRPQH